MDSKPIDIYAEKEDKLKELQAQEEKLKGLQADLAKLNAKVENQEPLSDEDTKFVSSLGWLTALSVTITAIAASLS